MFEILSPHRRGSEVAAPDPGKGRSRRCGFSLLEVVLALALAVVVITLIGVAVSTYMRAADASRMEVEEAQVARNVLNLIAKDLQSAVLYEPMDVSDLIALMGPDLPALLEKFESVEGLESIADLADAPAGGASAIPASPPSGGGALGGIDPENITAADVQRLLSSIDPNNPPSIGELRQVLSGGGGSAAPSSGDADSSDGDDEEDSSSGGSGSGSANNSRGSSSEDDSPQSGSASSPEGTGDAPDTDQAPGQSPHEDIASAPLPPSQPGLFGNPYELMIDTSQLPRLDEYALLYNRTDAAAGVRPSDVKSVAYYVAPPVGRGPQGPIGGGLVRRSLDRAVTRFQAENGTYDQLAAAGEMLAPEVVGIEFRYFDGLEWFAEWDSLQQQGLPVAVEIAVAVSRHREIDETFEPAASLFSAQQDLAAEPYRVFRRVVHIPAARPTDQQSLLEEGRDPSQQDAAAGESTASPASSSSAPSPGGAAGF